MGRYAAGAGAVPTRSGRASRRGRVRLGVGQRPSHGGGPAGAGELPTASDPPGEKQSSGVQAGTFSYCRIGIARQNVTHNRQKRFGVAMQNGVTHISTTTTCGGSGQQVTS